MLYFQTAKRSYGWKIGNSLPPRFALDIKIEDVQDVIKVAASDKEAKYIHDNFKNIPWCCPTKRSNMVRGYGKIYYCQYALRSGVNENQRRQ